MKGSYLRVLPTRLILHSFNVTFFTLGSRLFLIQLQINTQKTITIHSEFIRLLFLQDHRETDRFFAASGVQPAQSTSGGLFHFKNVVFLSQCVRKSAAP